MTAGSSGVGEVSRAAHDRSAARRRSSTASRGLSSVSVDDVEYDWLAPVSDSANIAVTLSYRGSQAAVNVQLQGHPLFSDDVTLQLDSLQALRLGLSFGQ